MSMDLQQLRYTVTVADTGSITAAARKLFMGQPNLSRSIRELEEELGIRLFERTPRGVAPTRSGESFLGYARSILAQIDRLEAMYRPEGAPEASLTLTGPRAGYVAAAFGRSLRLEQSVPVNARYREAAPSAVIGDVASGAARLGIVRWQAQHAAALDGLVRENGLCAETLWEFCMAVTMHKAHPLAALQEIPFEALAGYPELVHGDLTPVSAADPAPAPQGSRPGCITVFDRGGQLDLVREIPECYVWASPLPADRLAQLALVQRPCPGATRYRDVLVRRPGALNAVEEIFLRELRREIDGLSGG